MTTTMAATNMKTSAIVDSMRNLHLRCFSFRTACMALALPILLYMFYHETFTFGKYVMDNPKIGTSSTKLNSDTLHNNIEGVSSSNESEEVVQTYTAQITRRKDNSKHEGGADDNVVVSVSWTEQDLKQCQPNMKKLNFTWWNEVVKTRQDNILRVKSQGIGSSNVPVGSPAPPQPPPRPIWLPGFPGSGNEMVGQLVQALTGGLGGMGIYERREGRQCTPNITATCKTHWPVIGGTRIDPRAGGIAAQGGVTRKGNTNKHSKNKNYQKKDTDDESIGRNHNDEEPAKERENKLPGHSTQASEEFWKRERDKKFYRHINNWVNLIADWESCEVQGQDEPEEMDDTNMKLNVNKKKTEKGDDGVNERGSYHNFLHRDMFLIYEQLTTVEHGPRLTIRLAQVLRDAGFEDVVAKDEDIPCLWYHVVKSRTLAEQLQSNVRISRDGIKRNINATDGQRTTGTTKRSPHSYAPEYTMKQKEDMIKALTDFKHIYENRIEEMKKESDNVPPTRKDDKNTGSKSGITSSTILQEYDNNDNSIGNDNNKEQKFQQSLELINILNDYLEVIQTTMKIEDDERTNNQSNHEKKRKRNVKKGQKQE